MIRSVPRSMRSSRALRPAQVALPQGLLEGAFAHEVARYMRHSSQAQPARPFFIPHAQLRQPEPHTVGAEDSCPEAQG
jgi:hypothetical protein